MKNTTVKFWFILFCAFTVTINAQKVDTTLVAAQPKVKTFKLDSKLMARQMPYNVILPADYENEKTVRYPVIYILHGLGGDYKSLGRSFGDNSQFLEYAAKHRFIIVTPEGGTGFYTDSATEPDNRYESYFIQELIPEIDRNFRSITERRGRAVAGASMGGYGALKYGVKYPQMFVLAASWSGAVNVASWRNEEQLLSIPFAKTIPGIKQILFPVFGDGTKPTLQENDLFKIFKEVSQEKIAGLPFFYLDCGTEDQLQLLEPNRQLAEILLNRKIPHQYRHFPGDHRLQAWLITDFLSLSERIFAFQKSASNK